MPNFNCVSILNQGGIATRFLPSRLHRSSRPNVRRNGSWISSLERFACADEGLEPGRGGPGRLPHLEGAGKLDPFDGVLRLALETPHQEAPGGGSEIVE